MTSIVTIKGKPIIDIYESYDGSYWFITEKCHKQDSVIDGKVYKDDQILFGYVRLSMCPEFAEFGYISEAELKLLGNRIWKVPRKNWSVCPEVKVQEIIDEPCVMGATGREDSSSRSSSSCSMVYKEVNKKMQNQVSIAGTPVVDIWECFNGRCWFITKKIMKKGQCFLSGYVRCLHPCMLAEFQHLPEEVFKDMGKRIWKVSKEAWHRCPCVDILPKGARRTVVPCDRPDAKCASGIYINGSGEYGSAMANYCSTLIT